METVIGIKFNDFVLIATDMTAAHSIMVMKDGESYILSTRLGTSVFL
jgi:20S proteasome alpha/beta subunit